MQPQLLVCILIVALIVTISARGKADKKKENNDHDDYYGNDL